MFLGAVINKAKMSQAESGSLLRPVGPKTAHCPWWLEVRQETMWGALEELRRGEEVITKESSEG